MKQQIKEKRKQPIRTCLHQPFEYNFRTLDQYASQDLVKSIQSIKNDQELSQYVQIKVGIRSAIRKLRANQSNFLALILIYDQSITDILIQASTVFWKYNQQIILAKEDIRTHLQKIMKIERINCVYMFTKKDIELPEDVKQKIQKITEQMNVFRKESVCEIPIILGDGMYQSNLRIEILNCQVKSALGIRNLKKEFLELKRKFKQLRIELKYKQIIKELRRKRKYQLIKELTKELTKINQQIKQYYQQRTIRLMMEY